MDRTEISEIFCGAVDTIVNARLQNLAYDITKQYTVIKNDLKQQGIYTVSNGSVSFEARSYYKDLEIDDIVMVTIPNGDYSNEKIIIAKIEPEQPENANYNSQLDLMQIFTTDIVVSNTIEQNNNPGLLANEQDGSSYIKLYTLENNGGNLSGYTRLGVSAEFQSLLNNTDTVSGNYGLKFYIYSSLPSAPGERDKDGIYELSLDARDMIGNPYAFNYYTKQDKVFDISMIENIMKIEVYFYQDGNFKDSTGKLINWQYSNNIIGLTENIIPNNLFTKNLQMYLGYEVGAHENDRMVICCEEPTIYSYTKYDIKSGHGPTKHLTLKWLHKFESYNQNNGKYELVNMITLKSLGFTIKWFRYNLNVKDINQIAGRGWEEIQTSSNNVFECSFIPDVNLAEERIKVIAYKTDITYESMANLLYNSSDSNGKKSEYFNEWQSLMENRNSQMTAIEIKDAIEFELLNEDNLYTQQAGVYIIATKYDKNVIYYRGPNNNEFTYQLEQLKLNYLDTIESKIVYESEELILTNAVKVYDSITFNAASSLSIYYEDGSEGNYYVYDTNGRLINAGQGRGYERRMRAVYNGKEITPELGHLDWIAWYLPLGNNSKTMILNNKAYQTKDSGIIESSSLYQGIEYICIRRYADQVDNTLNTWQSYSINNNWNNAYTNNMVRCEVSIDGVRYTASNTMRFGKAGTQGTNTTLILEMVDNYNAITVPVPTDSNNEPIIYSVIANPYDVNGNKLDPSSGNWIWGWKTPMVLNKKQQPVIEIDDSLNNSSNQINLKVNIKSLSEVAEGYYGILYATYQQANNIPLTAYLSIPLKAPQYSHIEGASEITYNSGGSPQYYSDAYKIFKNNEDDVDIPFSEIFNVDWNVVHNVDYYKIDKNGEYVINPESGEKEISAMCVDYIPKLYDLVRSDSEGYSYRYQGLQAAPFFAEGYDNICVTCSIHQDDPPSTEVLWVQPLLITKSNYDYSVLNEWDGSLTTDEGNSTVMAAMIGAGRKNEDNTFSGILMGDVKDLGDLSDANYLPADISENDFYKGSYYYKDNDIYIQAETYDKNEEYYELRAATGLYGFQNGEISFALKDSGIATFGKSNRGQIIIDGNQSTIKSKGYSLDGNGMEIDLDDGVLQIKDNNVLKFQLQPKDPYLVINGITDKNPIIHIGAEEYFLQSQSKSFNGLGTRFDLNNGILDIQGSGGQVYLSGVETDPFFKVTTKYGQTLIHMDTDRYYLQSAFFSGDSQIRKTKDDLELDIYQEAEYIQIVLSPEQFEIERKNLYKLEGSRLYKQITNEEYNETGIYYKKGNPEIVFGYNEEKGILYNLVYDSEIEEFKATTPIDIYEDDESGNFKYPIVFSLSHYEKTYQLIELTEETYITEQYYIKQEDETYLLSNDIYNNSVQYYDLIYIPVQNDLPDVEASELSKAMIQRYVYRELEPVLINSVPSGMRMDLVNGRIEGYNLKLIGTQILDGKITNRLIINTEDDITPVKIGKNFYVKWNGEMGCTKVATLKYVPDALENLPDSGVYGATPAAEEIVYELDLKNGTFNGNALTASTADNATRADVADSLSGGDSFWDDIFNGHGNKRYVLKTVAEKVYGSLNYKQGQSTLEERIESLESSRDNHSSSIINLQNMDISQNDRFQKIEKHIENLQNMDISQNDRLQKIEDEKYNEQLNDLKKRIEDLEEIIKNLTNTI